MHIMKSTLRLKDNIFDFYDQDEKEVPLYEPQQRIDYYKPITKDTPVADRTYVALYFRAESAKNFYTREGYDILTFLGDLGGLFDIVFLAGASLTSFFAGKIMKITLIHSIYKINYKNQDNRRVE